MKNILKVFIHWSFSNWLSINCCNFGDVKSGEVTLKSLRTTKDTISLI